MGAPDKKRGLGLAVVALVLALPLIGAALAGRDLGRVFEFPPPLEISIDYVSFSGWVVVAVTGCVAGVVVPWLIQRGGGNGRIVKPNRDGGGRWPWWGTVAIGWTGMWWMLAWTRSDWFAPWQRYTFFPLWLGFIVSVAALTERRTGTCFMRRAPWRWLWLFAASAGCWWGFEWLNRFVQNWHYIGVQDLGAVAYAVHASLCFATPLPAVAGVAEWLDTHVGWRERMTNGPRWRWLDRRTSAVALIIIGAAGMAGSGAWPKVFYPMMWIGPLALWFGIAQLTGLASPAREIARGDWSRVATWMVAALGCGFFWEMWNWHSAAKWVYTVPGVERWFVFEMPLPGYAGYLPFGLECLLVAEGVIGVGGASRGWVGSADKSLE